MSLRRRDDGGDEGEVEVAASAARHAERRPPRRSEDDDDGDDDTAESRHAPRDIPTWKEVIGQIIAGNMEAPRPSPKSGGGGSYRGRGGRGHGNRGGGESGGRRERVSGSHRFIRDCVN